MDFSSVAPSFSSNDFCQKDYTFNCSENDYSFVDIVLQSIASAQLFETATTESTSIEITEVNDVSQPYIAQDFNCHVLGANATSEQNFDLTNQTISNTSEEINNEMSLDEILDIDTIDYTTCAVNHQTDDLLGISNAKESCGNEIYHSASDCVEATNSLHDHGTGECHDVVACVSNQIPTVYIPQEIKWKFEQLEELYLKTAYRMPDWQLLDGEVIENPFAHWLREGHYRVLSQLKFMKLLDGFRDVNEDDKVVLVKSAWMEIFLIRTLMNLHPSGKYWTLYDQKGAPRNMNFGFIFQHYGCRIQSQYEALVRSFKKEWYCDKKLMLTLYAIVLFNPDRNLLITQEIIRQNQYSFYLWLLYHYLTDFYRSSDPKMKFAELQNCIKNIRELGHTMHKHLISGGILTQVFAENACQVLCEVLGFFDAFPDDRSMIKWQRNTC